MRTSFPAKATIRSRASHFRASGVTALRFLDYLPIKKQHIKTQANEISRFSFRAVVSLLSDTAKSGICSVFSTCTQVERHDVLWKQRKAGETLMRSQICMASSSGFSG